MTKQSIAVLIALVLTTSACASMPTKQRRAREAAEIGLVSHPELADIMAALARLEAAYDTLRETLMTKINAVEEAHRDDTELVIDYVRRQIEDLKALTKGRP